MLSVYDQDTGQRRPMQPGEPYPPLSDAARDLIRVIFANLRSEHQGQGEEVTR